MNPQPANLNAQLSGEFAFIDWIRRQTSADPRVPIGIGDDAAALRLTPGREVLVTTDMILEGVHFERPRASARAIGRKAMAVNLSDIAAMAGVPVAAVASVGLPRDFRNHDAEELFHGMHDLAGEFGVALVGGDTNCSESGLVVAITLIGEATSRGPVRRSGARLGDWIMVTGSLGGSILSKHLDFTPRVREAIVLHERCELHAMIDVSDGLAADLGHILDESGCGAILRADEIPISAEAHNMPGEATSLDRALYDGEDFELLFTLPGTEAERLVADQPLGVRITHIGTVAPESGLWLESSDGSRRLLAPNGFDHFAR